MQYFEGLRESECHNVAQYILSVLTDEKYCDDRSFAEYLAEKAIEEYVEYRIAERAKNRK